MMAKIDYGEADSVSKVARCLDSSGPVRTPPSNISSSDNDDAHQNVSYDLALREEMEYPPGTDQSSTSTKDSNSLSSDESSFDSSADSSGSHSKDEKSSAFLNLRVTYLLVTLVIMLADGLQGTHLYVLYESYGFSVASLYCLGFATGGCLSPLTGPMVDHIGRKKAALLYCALEVFINLLEQFPFFYGLVASRMIGGFTTNLLATVFETWLDTEYKKRRLQRENYELILRDSMIVSNMAAIFSGYVAHLLASHYGAVGPFRGAVTCTAVAFIIVLCVWTENYGTSGETEEDDLSSDETDVEENEEPTSMIGFFYEAMMAYAKDSKMLRVGILQGFTAGSIQIFVFLWVPALRHFSQSSSSNVWGLDANGEPAYGLIFGAYMACGVLGGLIAPSLRNLMTSIVKPLDNSAAPITTIEIDGEGIVPVRPMSVEVLASLCYLFAAALLFVPCFVKDGAGDSFFSVLVAFLFYELIIGIFLPCEGVIRSLYFPDSARASVMALPRIIVNFAVAIGVVSTNHVSLRTAFGVVASLMVVATFLQLSLVSMREWASLFTRANELGEICVAPAKRLSFSIREAASRSPSLRRLSSSVRSLAAAAASVSVDDVSVGTDLMKEKVA